MTTFAKTLQITTYKFNIQKAMVENIKSCEKLEFLVKVTLICANIIILLGIGFGTFQYMQTERISV